MPTEQAANPLTSLPIIPYILIFVIFYFFVIKPQRQKQKDIKNMQTNMKKGDDVVTSSGIHGSITLVKDKTVMVKVDDNVKIEMDKESIVTIIKAKE